MCPSEWPRGVDPAEVIGDFPGYRVAVGCKGDVWFDATRNGFSESRRRKRIGGKYHFSMRTVVINPLALKEIVQNPRTES
jgi:hypothetical protein